MFDVVVVGELAERFAGSSASNRRRVGNEPTRSRPRLERDGGLWQLKRVIGEGAGEDGRVDQVDGLFQGAQLVGVEHGLGAPTGGDDTLSDLVERVVLVGTGGRQPRCVMLVQQGLVLIARRTPTRPVLSRGELEGVQLFPLERGLFVGPPSHLSGSSRRHAEARARALLSPKLPRLRELLFDLRPREIAADGGVAEQ